MSSTNLKVEPRSGRKVNWLVEIAFTLGFIAVAMAAFERSFIVPPKKEPASKKEALWEAAKSVVSKKLSPEKDDNAATKGKHPYQLAYIGIGVAAVGLGAFGWTRFAHSRLAAAAVALGLIAIAWEWAVVGIGIAVVILILASLS
jgi:hypothetical protein